MAKISIPDGAIIINCQSVFFRNTISYFLAIMLRKIRLSHSMMAPPMARKLEIFFQKTTSLGH
jgi:hypothetical protein